MTNPTIGSVLYYYWNSGPHKHLNIKCYLSHSSYIFYGSVDNCFRFYTFSLKLNFNIGAEPYKVLVK